MSNDDYDLDAEEAVLGSILRDTRVISKVAPILKAEDFYDWRNRHVYESCLSIHEQHGRVDQISVAIEIARLQKLPVDYVDAYLSHLVSQVPTSEHAENYANIVQRLSITRGKSNCQRCGKTSKKLFFTPASYMNDIGMSWLCEDCYLPYSALQTEHRLEMIKWATGAQTKEPAKAEVPKTTETTAACEAKVLPVDEKWIDLFLAESKKLRCTATNSGGGRCGNYKTNSRTVGMEFFRESYPYVCFTHAKRKTVEQQPVKKPRRWR